MRFRPINKETALIAIVVLGLAALYSLGTARLGHSIPDEKRYLQSTKEMVESGDYITPRYHGELRFQKPILFYWLIILSYKIFGVGVLGARIPSIAAALLQVILVYLLGKDLFGRRAGIFSALVLATCEVYFMYARFAAPDMVFTLFMTASIYLFVKAYRGDIKGRFKYIYLYACMGLAMLTKGPLGLIYPALAIIVFLAARKEWIVFKQLNIPLGLAVFALVSGPWFIVMTALHGNAYLAKVWSAEILKKLKYVPSAADGSLFAHYFRSLFYYTGMVCARHLPWTIFLPAALAAGPADKALSADRQGRGVFGSALIGAWFFTVFICLSLIWSKESYYVLGLSAPLSLFLGAYFSRFSVEGSLPRNALFRLPFILAVVFSFLALLAWLWFIIYVLDKPFFSYSLALFVVPVLMALALIARNKIFLPAVFFIASFAIFAYFAGYIMPAIDRGTLSEVAERIDDVIVPGDVVGVASSAVSYHRLNVSLEDYKVIRADKQTIEKGVSRRPLEEKKDFINEFLSAKETRVFCVITRDDYRKLVADSLKDKMTIMYQTHIWKRIDKQGMGYFRKLFAYILRGEREKLREALKEEIYLVSNRSGGNGAGNTH